MLKRLFPLSLILYRGSDELNHDFVLVGYGRTGAGRTGASDYDGLKRGCQNRIEEYMGGNNQSMAFLFNAPPAGFPLEGKGGPGDIGSAAFALIDGKYWLAGIGGGGDDFSQDGIVDGYGDIDRFTRVGPVCPWVYKTAGLK